MTGWLAIVGVFVVVVASAFSGLTEGDNSGSAVDLQPVSSTAGPGSSQGTDQDAQESRVEPTATPEPPPPTATPGSETNRENCDIIRGTQYRSPEERTWYLANCVRN